MQAKIRKLKNNRNYSPIETLENEEVYRNGIFEWNISKIIRYIKEHEGDILKSVIEVDKHHATASINQGHIDTVDLSVPVIQAEINPDKFIIIDGHHRLAKARKNHVPYINSYKLIVSQHIPFFISNKSYTAFVEYWNSKVHDMR